jgi:hypothetical protein
MKYREKRAIRKAVERELQETWDKPLEAEGRKGEERLTVAERAELTGIAMRRATFWGAIVGAVSLLLAGLTYITGWWEDESWWLLAYGPMVWGGYFFWKRRQMLNKSAEMWREKRRAVFDEEVAQRMSEVEVSSNSRKSLFGLSTEQLIHRYGAVLMDESKGIIRDTAELPAAKDEIKAALIEALGLELDHQTREHLKTGYITLGSFQDGAARYKPLIYDPEMTPEEVLIAAKAMHPPEMLKASNVETQQLVDDLKNRRLW